MSSVDVQLRDASQKKVTYCELFGIILGINQEGSGSET